MKDNVLAMKIVLPNGDLVATSRRARKSSAGYDLTHLFVGAGTLGVRYNPTFGTDAPVGLV